MPSADEAVRESPLRRAWRSEEDAVEAVLAFHRRYGEEALRLACHAAFPLFVSPELVNLIHVNFLDDGAVPWVAEADFLLSPLCRPVGGGVYQVCPRGREVLLAYLVEEAGDGPRRLVALADFLLAYLERPTGPKPRPEIVRAQQWIAWSYLAPRRAVADMAGLLHDSAVGEGSAAGQTARQAEVAGMAEIVRAPIAGKLPDRDYHDLYETVDLLADFWYESKELPGAAGPTATATGGGEGNQLLREVVESLRGERLDPVSESRPREQPASEPCRPPRPPEPWIDRAEYATLVNALLRPPGRSRKRKPSRPPGAGQTRIVLFGRPGIGKTALAAKAAWDDVVRATFHDGVLWVNVRSFDDLTGVLPEIAQFFGVKLDDVGGVEAPMRRVAELVRGRRCLLIINSLYTPPASANNLLTLPFQGILLIARVRSPDSDFAEWASDFIRVHRLSDSAVIGALWPMVPRITDQRLLARAAAVTRGWPFALRIVARLIEQGITEGQPPIELVRRLEREAETVRRQKLDPPTYWHWAGLGVDPPGDGELLRHRFAVLSVFATEPADFDVLAVRPQWNTDPQATMDQLLAFQKVGLLRQGSLLNRFALSPEGAAVGAAFLGDDSAEPRRIHAQYYVGLVNDHEDATDLLAPELGQIQWAWESLPKGDREQIELIRKMGPTYRRLGHGKRYADWVTRAIISTAPSELPEAVDLAIETARADAQAGQPREAEETLRGLLPLVESMGDTQREGEVLLTLAEVKASRKQLQEAIDYYDRAVAIFRRLGDHVKEAVALSDGALVLRLLGGYDSQAREWEWKAGRLPRYGEHAPPSPQLDSVYLSNSARLVEIIANGINRSKVFHQPEVARQMDEVFKDGGGVTHVEIAQRLLRAGAQERPPVEGLPPGFTTLGFIFEGLVRDGAVERDNLRFLAYVITRYHLIDTARASLAPELRSLLGAGDQPAAQDGGAAQPPDRPRGAVWRVVHDAMHGTDIPGRVARREGDPPTGDEAVDEAYDNLGITHAFFWQVFGRDSYDDGGAPLVAVVHYGEDFMHCYWDGARIVIGDGDGRVFRRFTPLDIVAHRFMHVLLAHDVKLAVEGEFGAIHESLADVMASLARQYHLRQTVAEADWLIGAELLQTGINGRALRSLAEPGTAYDDPQMGGRDPQPAHMREYVTTTEDQGGIHINGGIPSRAFYLLATALGGHAWEKAGRIWYEAVRAGGPVGDPTMGGFARLTRDQAVRLFGEGSREAAVVVAAWQDVGIEIGGPDRKSPGQSVPVTENHLALIHSSWRYPKKDAEFGRQMYCFHVVVQGRDEVLDRIEYVKYRLDPSYPNPDRTVTDRKSRFKLKELAWGESTVRAEVKVKGQEEPIQLSRHINLNETGPRI
jgi:tetratricopeptide (TPR) repeat protein